jgi:hypothetical protein
MEPSPITAMVLAVSPLRDLARLIPRLADMDVELWPVSKAS